MLKFICLINEHVDPIFPGIILKRANPLNLYWAPHPVNHTLQTKHWQHYIQIIISGFRAIPHGSNAFFVATKLMHSTLKKDSEPRLQPPSDVASPRRPESQPWPARSLAPWPPGTSLATGAPPGPPPWPAPWLPGPSPWLEARSPWTWPPDAGCAGPSTPNHQGELTFLLLSCYGANLSTRTLTSYLLICVQIWSIYKCILVLCLLWWAVSSWIYEWIDGGCFCCLEIMDVSSWIYEWMLV